MENETAGFSAVIRKMQVQIACGLREFANSIVAVVRWCAWPGSKPEAPQSICIYRVGNLGDILCAMPAMHAVRTAYPRARLTLVTSPGRKGMPGAVELLTGANWLDELFVYYQEDIQSWPQRIDLAKKLGKRKFDVWIEFPSDLATLGILLRNMILAKAAGVRWADGWRLTTIRWAVRAQSEGKIFPREVDRLLRLVEGLGIAVEPAQFPLPLTERHASEVDAELRDRVASETPIVAIAPGAKRTTNIWPLDRYAEVAQSLAAQGFFVLLLGGASDKEACEGIASRVSGRIKNLAGRLSVLGSCEALRRCDFAICNDSGVQHLAAAVSTPCISIFSVRDMRGKWHPYGSLNVILENEVPCHTCYLEECPFDNLCVKQIPVSQVLSAAQKMSTSHPVVVPKEVHSVSSRQDNS